MSTITTIQNTDLITNSRAVINNNFSNLNTDKIETSVLDTDTTLAANSDSKVATQKAVKAYVDSGGNPDASTTQKGVVEEATQAELTAGTTTGGTGARLFLNPVHTTSTSAGAGDAGKLVKLNGSGYLDSTLITGFSSDLKTYSVAENMDGTTTPVPVCINPDGNLRKGSANTSGYDQFIGFVTSNITTAETTFLNTSSNDSSTTLSFTPSAGTDKALFVHVAVRRVAGVNLPSAVTWNGVAMVLVDSQTVSAIGHAVYSLAIGTSTTTANVSVTVGAYDWISIQAVCYAYVNQTTTTVIKAKATGTSSAPSLALNPTQSYSKVLNFLVTSGVKNSWNDGQTERADGSDSSGIFYFAADVTNPTGASVTYDATLAASYNWGLQNIEINTSTLPTASAQVSGRLAYPSLTANSKYYLQNTAGTIGTSPGSTTVLLGKALSTTELIIIQS